MGKAVSYFRSPYELKKLADFWLDLSKLIMASLVLKFFEPRGIPVTATTGAILFVGLFLSVG